MTVRSILAGVLRQLGRGRKGASVQNRLVSVEALESRELLSANWYFDYGTAASPVQAGYTQVTEATKYDSTKGYGWVSGAVQSADRGTGSALTRDINGSSGPA